MRVKFIGTSAGTPTAIHGTSGIFVNLDGDGVLFDCGEGTQKRMMKFGASINIDAIFLTHLDSDHVLGVPGLIRTLELNNRGRELDIYVEERIADRVRTLVAGVHGWPDFNVNVRGFSSGDTLETFGDFSIRCFKTNHDGSSHGFVIDEDEREGRFQMEKVRDEYGLEPGPKYGDLKSGNPVEAPDGTTIKPSNVIGDKRPGRKLVYTGDTRMSENTIENSRNADVLVHESTFSSEDSDKASQTSHSTASEAAQVANKADVETLVLTHISPRYGENRNKLREEAEEIFTGEIRVADDGMEVEVPYRD
jgi:ribonuclease Z